jgi:cytochrome c553
MHHYHPILAALVALCVWGLAHAEGIDPLDQAAAQRVAVGTCASCHGPQGNSISPKFPVLAGQNPKYMASQLHAFKDKTRGDPDALGYMWGMASPLSDDSITALADYYGRQTPLAGSRSSPQVAARGKEIYLNGNPGKGIPACAACHGLHAEGNDNFPRLSGQHAQYLIKQLRSFQSNLRNVAIMHGVAKGLETGDLTAVAAYLQSL